MKIEKQKQRFGLDEMLFDIDLHCENTGFLQRAAQKSSVFRLKVNHKMHFVETESIFLLFSARL